jgi:hypothetical protein
VRTTSLNNDTIQLDLAARSTEIPRSRWTKVEILSAMELCDLQVFQSRILQVLSGTLVRERSRGSERGEGLNMPQVMSTGGVAGGMFAGVADLGSKSCGDDGILW